MSCIPRCQSRSPSRPPLQTSAEASAVAGPAPAVEYPVERSGDALAQAVEHGAPSPVASVELLRLAAVGREDRGGLRGERGAFDFLVGLEIPAEAPAVEIARAHAQPVIAQGHLPVEHPRLVL